MEDHQKDLQNLYKDAVNNPINVEKQLVGKENYLKLCNYINNPIGKNNGNDGKNSKNNNVLHADYLFQDKSNSSTCLQDLTENRSNSHDLEQEHSNLYSAYQCQKLSNSMLIEIQSNIDSNKIIDNIDRNKDQDITADDGPVEAVDRDVEGDEEEDGNTEEGRSRTTFHSDDFFSDSAISQVKFKVNDKPAKDYKAEEEDKDNISSHLKLLTAPLQTQAALVAFAETQNIATTTPTGQVQSAVNQHINNQQLLNDAGQQILNGQQIRVQNLLDVAGSLCAAEPIGALCDAAAFSKIDCSQHDANQKNEVQNSPDLLAKKYYHPLYSHGVCRWPGCELPLEDVPTFVKHFHRQNMLKPQSEL